MLSEITFWPAKGLKQKKNPKPKKNPDTSLVPGAN